MYSLSCIITAWWWPNLGPETSRCLIYIFIKVCSLWLEILFDLCEWYANEDVTHTALPAHWDLYTSLHFRHCSEVGFQAVKNVQQISLPWHFPHSDVAQLELASAWMRLIGLYRNVENRLSSYATSYHRIAEPQYQWTKAEKLHTFLQWLPHIIITGQHPAIYRRIQGSLTRHWEENNYCKLEECVMNYRNCSRLNI